jgi:nucleotide-binding universal stress UspA family protein
MFGDVVVPLDGSRDAARALGPAAALVRRTKGTLMAAAFTTDDDHFGVADAVRRQLDEFDYIKTEVLVEHATASIPDELAALVASNPGAIVCMTTAGRGRAAGITGSVAKDLLRAIEVPVLLVGPDCETDRFRLDGTMIVTLDPGDRSHEVLPAVELWARTFGQEPEIVTVIDPRTDTALRAAQDADLVGDMLVDTVMVRRTAKDLSDSIGAPVTYETLHESHTAEEILRHANQRDASVIAMATHGETGVNRLVFGSITAGVVRRALCPVLVIRPQDLD